MSEPPEDRLARWAEEQTCGCGHRGLRVEWRFTFSGQPYSLSGTTPKLSVAEVPFLLCPACGRESEGVVSADE